MTRSPAGPRWLFPETSAVGARDPARDPARELAAALGLRPVAARVLVARGVATPEAARAFLSDALAELPDPFAMKGMDGAVERLCRAVAAREAVALYGDYDVDGVSSTAMLASFLDEVGLPVRTYIPHRLGEGYGLNSPAVERLAAEGARVLVTLDCGITAHAEIARANACGLDVIVVDHHAVPETMPPALAVLNPLQPGCAYPTKGLCAGGVTFALLMALRKALRERGAFQGRAEPNLRRLLELAALATVADVVPLVGANRILVAHGLKELTASTRPGIQALKEVADLGGATIDTFHVGFRLGPRINAAGRLDDASVGLRLLLTKDLAEARGLARVLDEANAERQRIEREMTAAAMLQAEEAVRRGARGLVLSSDRWHPGVVGIVASRVVERFHRPALLVAVRDGVGRGSARSVDGFHLHDALGACAAHLVRYGGHRAAAGVTVLPERLPALAAAFEAIAAERLAEDELVGRCRIDAVLSEDELSMATVEALQALAPFGMGNPEPVLVLQGQRAAPRVLPSRVPAEPGHLKLALGGAPHVDCIGFRLGHRRVVAEAGPVDLAFQVSVDEFRGVRRLSLKLKDLRPAAAAP